MLDFQVFEFSDYKAVLKAKIKENASVPSYKSKLSKAMSAPQAFLSQVLHSHVHLTLDHAFKLSSFWNFTSQERIYFLNLVQWERAGSPEYKHYLHLQLEEGKKKSKDLSEKFQKPKIEGEEKQWLYYSSWWMAAIHMLLTIPPCQTLEVITKKLALPRNFIETALKTLQKLGLVVSEGQKWIPTKTNIHLSKQSSVSPLNHMIWRQKAIQALDQPRESNLHYSTLHTLSRKDMEKFRQLLMKCIEDTRNLAHPSPEEELICFCLDYFVI